MSSVSRRDNNQSKCSQRICHLLSICNNPILYARNSNFSAFSL